MLRKASIVLALVVLVLSFNLSGEYFGYERGFHHAAKDCAAFYSAHDTAYQGFAEVYLAIKWLLFAFIIGKLIKIKWLSQIICVASLGGAIYQYREIYLHKSFLFRIVDIKEFRFFDLIRDTIPIDWFCFSIVSVLFIYQIITTIHYWFYEKRK